MDSAMLHRLAETGFNRYRDSAGAKTWDRKLIPEWSALGEAERRHWNAAARGMVEEYEEKHPPYLTEQEVVMIEHAASYVEFFRNAAVPGQSHILLINKLAKAMGLS